MYLSTVYETYAGITPKTFRYAYLTAITRAKALLSDVDLPVINENLSTIAWMIEDFPSTQTDNTETADKDPTFDDIELTPAQLLNRQRHEINLDTPDSLTWPQYFGVLAFYLCNKARLLEMLIDKEPVKEKFKTALLNTYCYNACHAIEATCLGEALLEQETIESRVKEKIHAEASKRRSLQAEKAANARHEALNKIKVKYCEYYLSGDFKTKKEAAGSFYDSLNLTDQTTLSYNRDKENAVRTLNTALRTSAKPPRNDD